MPIHDLAGQRFDRLIVVARAPNKRSKVAWFCRCDCGNECIVCSGDLVSMHTRSCGCLQRDSRVKHGLYKTPEYMAWCAMNSRCYTSSHVRHMRYGGRGIAVCERWHTSFENFLADMGSKPGPEYSLDRIDNDEDYTPENCRWATREMQDNNRSDSLLLTFCGQTKTATQWSRELGLPIWDLRYRLRAGWPIDVALTQPVMHGCHLNARKP